MRTIRASEINTYLYCHRAWWYQLQGYEPANQAELVGGTELHYRHGRMVMISGCLRFAAYGMILLALLILVIYLTNQLF
jgi:hypothetical protein